MGLGRCLVAFVIAMQLAACQYHQVFDNPIPVMVQECDNQDLSADTCQSDEKTASSCANEK